MKRRKKTNRAYFAIALSLLLFGYSPAIAATYHVSPKGSNIFGNGTTASPWKSIGYGLRRIRSGDTLVIGSGIYNSPDDVISSPPSGTMGKETVIRAERDGSTVITSPEGLFLTHDVSHVRIEGLKFDAPHSKRILGNHIRIFRTAFRGGPVEGNSVQVGIGSNDHDNTRRILLEDCWVYGKGGRYNILIYNSRQVVLRRVVIRHDGGWTDRKMDPESATCVYNSSQVSLQNVIVIDSDRSNYHNWYGAFFSTADGKESFISWLGCISLNNRATGFGIDPKYSGAFDNLLMRDVIAYANDWGITLGSRGTVEGLIDHATVGKTSSSGEGIAKWGSRGSVSVQNSVLFDTGVSFFRGVDVLAGNSEGTGFGKNGNSNLLQGVSKSGNWLIKESGNVRIGAVITNRIGIPGTHYGDTGWDSITADSLWPWAFEDRIRNDFSEVDYRGFCAQKTGLYGGELTLTSYIWEYLGSPCPPGICSRYAPVK